MRPTSLLAVLPLALLLGLVFLACGDGSEGGAGAPGAVSGRSPGRAPTPGYVDEARCAACHAEEARRWRGSHHDLAMQAATPETVLGDFGDVTFEHLGERWRFFRRDGGFWVETRGEDGERGAFEVRYAFGVEPLQQYLVELSRGRLQCLTVAWDTGAERWFSLDSDESHPPGDALHWTGRLQSWNAMCAECHSTALAKAYDAEADAYATRWARIDVGCQACHGPGAEHVAWAEEGAAAGGRYGLAADLSKGRAEQLDACAPCHARRAPLRDASAPGEPFLDGYVPERLHDGLYHADGQILDEVYVYGSFVQSKMHAAGVSCTDCHDPHSLDLWTPGNSLCLQCHSPFAPRERFPDLRAAEYDTPEHHHHPQGSSGARCVSCHMPERTYMVVDPRRDHAFRVPRPDLTVERGVPNACNGCHDDRSAEWAAAAVREWYGERGDGPDPVGERTSVFARARRGEDVSRELARVAGDADQPGLVRATALELLAPGPPGRGALADAVDDPDPLVRASAARGFRSFAPEERAERFGALLGDGRRSVRAAAARALVGTPLPPERREAFAAALEEYLAAQDASLDLPAASMNEGVLRQEAGDAAGAAAAYRRALALDAAFLPARFNLATLLNGAGRNEEAEKVLREGIAFAPEEGELHFSLGLLSAETGDFEGAAGALREAAALLPERERLHYNLGLVLRRLGRDAEAEAALQTAVRRAPDDPQALHALVELYRDREEWGLALPFAERLERRVDGAPWAVELTDEIRSHVGPVGR